MKLKGKAKRIDELHQEYEALLGAEINSMFGIVAAHGWGSQLYEAGRQARKRLRDAGSTLPLPEGE